MQYKTAALFAVGLASSAAATGWLNQDAYSSPSNSDNQCSDKQQGGYDWSGLDFGSFESYGSNKFSGFSCGNSFGKRDLLTKRTFQSKRIQGSLDKQPSMSCEGRDDKFTIDELEVSTSEDADVECNYGMPDGSVCKQTYSCSSGGNVIKNSQCGGARSVTFKPGKNAPSGCSVGVHSIRFNCETASSSVPASTPAPSTSSYVMTPGYTSRTAETTSSVPAPSCDYGDEDCSSSATPSGPASSSASCAYGEEGCEGTSSAPATTATPGYTSREWSEGPSSPVSSAYVSSAYVSSASVSSASVSSASVSSATPSSPASSSAPVESTSSCAYGDEGCDSETTGVPGYTQKTSSTENSPVGSTSIPSYGVTTSSAIPSSSAPYPISSSSKSIPAYGTGSVSSSTENLPVSSNTPEYPEPSYPGVLPKCLKTWLHVTKCKDAGDSKCFCGNDEFIKQVHACLPAWAEDDEASAAASYLMGLCAPQIPANPGIITYCPSTLTPTATPTYTAPASSAPVSSAPVSAPVSSAPVSAPVSSAPVSAPVSSAPVSAPVSSAPVSAPSSTENSPVQSSAPEYAPSSSEASPVESEEVPPPAYTPITRTYWSTAEITITSCGAEVTNCPASSTVVQTTSTPVISVETTPASSTPYSPVTTSPAGSPPIYSVPVESESASSPYSPITTSAAGSPPVYSAPAGSSPAVPEGGYTAPPAQTAPVTTITYSNSVEVPATYTEGVSQGYEIPDSTYTTNLVTTITVPQVAITTVTLTQNGQETTSVGLGAGSPAPAPATPTADAIGGYGAGPTGSAGFGTSYVPKPTASDAPIEQYGNSGVKVGSSIASIVFGAVAVVMAF